MPHLLQLLLLLFIIVIAAKAAGSISVRFGQPAVFGELLIGLLLGPTALDLLNLWPFANSRELLGHSIRDFSELGVILLMLVAGLETDLKEMRQVGRVALWSAIGGVVLPMAGGALASRMFGFDWRESVFIGTVLTATSVSISAQTLMELKALKSKEGSTILGAAVIDDVLGIIVLSFVTAFSAIGTSAHGDSVALPALISGSLFNGGKTAEIFIVMLLMGLFFVFSIWVGKSWFDRLLGWASRIPASQSLLAATISIAFIYSFLAQYIGQVAAITGSYIAGVLYTLTRFKDRITESLHPLTYSLFVPAFFISIGMSANGRDLVTDTSRLLLMAVILLVAILGKILGCGLAAWACGFSRVSALRVGIGMISRGEVGLIVAGVGLSSGVISQEIFSIMVIMVLVTTMITPILLRYVFPRVKHEARGDVYESIADVRED